MTRHNLLIISVLIIAATLRFWRLDVYPALNADEAAIGYNAYSLIQTGKDEHGNSWPIHFQSFNDFKPGLYFYLVLPFVKIIGLNEWAVRLPGAILGVLTVLILYFLIKEYFKDKRLGILAAATLAISPWHLHFSRGGWEVNMGTFLIVLGVWLFFKAFRNSKYFILSSISFVLALYSYHAARIVVPLLLLGLFALSFKQIRSGLRTVLVAGIISLILLIPLTKDLVGPAGISRASGVGLFADPGPFNRINEQRGEHNNLTGLETKLFHNKAVNYGLAFLDNWAKHYHGEFLFLSGDVIQRNKVQETGQMYLYEIVTVLVGLIFAIKKLRTWVFPLLWLVVAPVASALTFQSPHALRAQNMVIPLAMVSAYGLLTIYQWMKTHIVKKYVLNTFYTFFVILIVANFARYIHMYWIHLAKEYPFSSQYGLKELAVYINNEGANVQKIWITEEYDQPYILLLFYLKYPPDKFQVEHKLSPRDQFGFSTVRDFGKFHFEKVSFDVVRPSNPNAWIVGTDEEIPEEANIVKEIYGSNEYKYFQVVAN